MSSSDEFLLKPTRGQTNLKQMEVRTLKSKGTPLKQKLNKREMPLWRSAMGSTVFPVKPARARMERNAGKALGTF